MGKAKLAMLFHCYQPVFNFDREIENAYKKAYLPLLEMLEEFPGVKASFHFSGNTLEWIEREYPQFIDKVESLIGCGQIELLGGGCFEPVMALIPERDRIGQIGMNDAILQRLFGTKPRGAWIAERVWEPGIAESLTFSGLEYTVLDDHHFERAGISKEDMYRPYATGSANGNIAVFPALTPLRYSMPFSPVEEVFSYMKGISQKREDEDTCFFFADDGEKFGAWPHTYKWVHEKGWLRRFFERLEQERSWIETKTYAEVLDETTPEYVDNIPSSSYPEMMKWSGGDFRNFIDKYPEADRMHKRMMNISDMVDAASFSEEHKEVAEKAKKELFKSQCSCAYWHGTFGGVYLPHLRSGVYKHLIRAQELLNTGIEGAVRAIEIDLDDSRKETVIGNSSLDVFVSPHEGGVIKEISNKSTHLNLSNVISRVEEGYHRKLEKGYGAKIRKARKEAAEGRCPDIHDVLGLGETGLSKVLHYDGYTRGSFVTHIFPDLRAWGHAGKGYHGSSEFLSGEYTSGMDTGNAYLTNTLRKRAMARVYREDIDLEVTKSITVGPDAAVICSHEVKKHSGAVKILRYGVEFNFLLWDKRFVTKGRLFTTNRLSLKDQYTDTYIDIFTDRKYKIFAYPIFTVNETERGLKKTFQGISVLVGNDIKGMSGNISDKMEISIAIG